jgi:hypothetical protein
MKEKSSVTSKLQTPLVIPPHKPTVPGVERLGLPVKEGKIFWEGVRATRRDELRKILRDSLPPEVPITIPPMVNATITNALYDVLVQLGALAATRTTGCTIDQALHAFALTEAEKTALADPTTKVLNKYLPPTLLDRYGDEIVLTLLLVTITRGKLAILQATLRGPVAVTPIRPIEPVAQSEGEVKSDEIKTS